MVTAADPAPADLNPAWVSVFMAGVVVLLWLGWWRYARPALRSQSGRATRLSPDVRMRRLAAALLLAIYPVMFTVMGIFTILNGNEPLPDGALGVVLWAVVAAPVVAAALALLALVRRTVDRHRARARHRALGLPDPPAPWWPSAVVGTWVLAVVAVSGTAGYLFWRVFASRARDRAALIQSRLEGAFSDPSVQQLVAGGASGRAVRDRMIEVSGTGGDIAAAADSIRMVGTMYLVAIGVIVVIIAGGGILLYLRQKRRRAAYDVRITESVTRASQLA